MSRHLYQRRIGGEQPDCHFRNKLRYQEADRSHKNLPLCCKQEHFFDPVVLASSVIVSCNRLESLVESHAHHQKEHCDPVDDTIGTNGHISTVFAQLLVDEHCHHASRRIHKERAGTDSKRLLGNPPVNLENRLGEVQDLAFVREEPEHIHKSHQLTDHSSYCSALDSHSESENQNRIKYRIGKHGKQRKSHRRLGMSGRTHKSVESEIQMRKHISDKDDCHIIPGIRESNVACSEKP